MSLIGKGCGFLLRETLEQNEKESLTDGFQRVIGVDDGKFGCC